MTHAPCPCLRLPFHLSVPCSESVLKKRLLDTSIGIGTQMADVDFEQLLSLSVSCGIAAVEGTAPQRIIYPSSGPVVDGGGSIRKFECADFFQPMQRLTVLQTHELLAFLQRVKPEVDRGRFGFAQYLSLNAPTAITGLPHGVLVEVRGVGALTTREEIADV